MVPLPKCKSGMYVALETFKYFIVSFLREFPDLSMSFLLVLGGHTHYYSGILGLLEKLK